MYFNNEIQYNFSLWSYLNRIAWPVVTLFRQIHLFIVTQISTFEERRRRTRLIGVRFDFDELVLICTKNVHEFVLEFVLQDLHSLNFFFWVLMMKVMNVAGFIDEDDECCWVWWWTWWMLMFFPQDLSEWIQLMDGGNLKD